MIKVLIADDQELIRESLKIVLGANEDMEVTGIAENGEQVLSEIKKNVLVWSRKNIQIFILSFSQLLMMMNIFLER